MAVKKWLASRLHTGKGWAEEGTVVITTERGTIIDLVMQKDAGDDVQSYDGTICPGFINAHCHLELSHLKGHIPPHTGIVDFLLHVMQLRRFRPEEKLKAMEAALVEMRGNGVVAVGDISNNTDSIAPKLTSDIYFHNFKGLICRYCCFIALLPTPLYTKQTFHYAPNCNGSGEIFVSFLV
jgi:cytosine/adenosine deaminase-related metal-dependent hydrolase